jgi:hypothetical protein
MSRARTGSQASIVSQAKTGSSQTTPSLYECNAKTVRDRRIWLERELLPNSDDVVSFGDVWDEFAEAVEQFTGDGTVTRDHGEAWKHFEPVFSNAYSNETGFSNALFNALRDSLKGVCEEILPPEKTGSTTAKAQSDDVTRKREMTLGDTNVGFATEFYREQGLAFPRHYGTSNNSKADHACIIFRRPRDKSNTSAKSHVTASVTKLDTDTRGDDVTAVVELKLDSTSCRLYKGNGIDLNDEQGPIGQCLMYVMDVFHSLIRRGCIVSFLKVTVVAAKKLKETKQKTGGESVTGAQTQEDTQEKTGGESLTGAQALADIEEESQEEALEDTEGLVGGAQTQEDTQGKTGGEFLTGAQTLADIEEETKAEALEDTEELVGGIKPSADTKATPASKVKLCCVQAQLDTPLELGDRFTLTVGRQVRFPEGNNEDYKEAAAVYLSAMKDGLQHAKEIREIHKPRSLCCQELLEDLQLLASPIPLASPASDFPVGIHQGELFRFTKVGIPIKEWIGLFPNSHCLASSDLEMEGCLVKISFITVHDTLVPLRACWKALDELAQSPGKDVVSDVLLACAFIEPLVLITVMKHLKPEKHPLALSHDNFPDREEVWKAFDVLVQSVLLPLANAGIVHNDIRCVPDGSSKYNICNVLAKRKSDGVLELKLIDYDSLVMVKHVDDSIPIQPHAVSICSFRGPFLSAHEFVFWQVLWMAYVLWLPMDGGSKPAIEGIHILFDHLFRGADDICLKGFKDWLSPGRMEKLREKMNHIKTLRNACRETPWKKSDTMAGAKVTGSNVVQETLSCLKGLFVSEI